MTPLEKAEAAWAIATATPSATAWETAARALYKVRRRAKVVRSKGKGRYPCPVAEATFANGRRISMSFWSQHGKPLDWDRAVRVCVSGYRCLHRPKPDGPQRGWKLSRLPLSAVPAIVSMRDKTTGETWEPAQ